ncbi:alpha-L-fucosidase [Verrucomicrobiaceae bacterium N1E253]|uniref:alpha-L-fucosidase n=2 Tax=Oceaniferula marina TaxID=2748318 RepID=A0A851GIL3_9BACT|nr:alpha-L-fucosidase [Oceaniferula marina]
MVNAEQKQLDPQYGEPAQYEQTKKKKPQKLANGKIKLDYGPLYHGKRQDPAMKKWRENRFGQFIHWGLYSIPGGVWEGKTYGYAAEFLKASAGISTERWNGLKDEFNPTEFNGKEWASMAKAMGAKYVCLTTKHHEGFCLWPSKYTEFDIENTPYQKDLMKEFVDAYSEAGIDVYLYYSVLDWYHPDWRTKLKTMDDVEAFERFKTFTQNQLVELLERYPQVKGLWFDGTWDQCWKDNGKFSYELEVLLKEKRPGLIVNSRLRADDFGKRHRDSNGDLMGDFESGYERRLPDPRDTSVTKNDWECCMTIPENQWGYHKDWTLTHQKNTNELLEMLAQCSSQGGNFLLNFGPNGKGVFRAEEKRIAREIGEWMKTNSAAIYGSDYAGLKKQDWGYFTKNTKSGEVYMIVFNVPISYQLRVELPKHQTISKANMVGIGQELQLEKFDSNETFVLLPPKSYTSPFVIRLELKANKKSQ